jgi:AraC family transcriptional regulator
MQNNVGKKLMMFTKNFKALFWQEKFLHSEIFYDIAESLAADQLVIYSQFSKVRAIKNETNQRLFHIILEAKQYIDIHFLEKMEIEKLAQTVCLSEFHFIRLFKQSFSISPYQYFIQCRLAHAQTLLSNHVSIANTAFDTGFADVFSFSKSFKNAFGMSPSGFQRIR